ncbi:unnamed protein product [Rangifer tarandus platyrhynchus]|uniref:Uncharacterized protein n=2 Tax=Rangifer tarandus platyrhynchus TaxID=3082113 RepID=A0ABN8XX62_RANTA|nr:unnamed protein product [Rangifer tarandus platyrhynchus]
MLPKKYLEYNFKSSTFSSGLGVGVGSGVETSSHLLQISNQISNGIICRKAILTLRKKYFILCRQFSSNLFFFLISSMENEKSQNARTLKLCSWYHSKPNIY